jgi:hypothetical protein
MRKIPYFTNILTKLILLNIESIKNGGNGNLFIL